MASYNVNGFALTSIFSTDNLQYNISITNYKQNGNDIDNLLERIYDADTAILNDAYRHLQNTNYKVNGVDIKSRYLPYYVESSTPLPVSGTYVTVNVPSWANYARVFMIDASGGGGS